MLWYSQCVVGYIPLQPNSKFAMDILWKSRVPLKVKVFGWRLLLNRLPTRSNLADRCVILNSQDKICVFCFHVVEEADHVFLTCPRTRMVWKEVESWLGIFIPTVSNCIDYMLAWFLKMIGKLSKSNACLIWLATWCLWWTRNQVIFNGVIDVPKELFDKVIYFSWWWLDLTSMNILKCNCYEWFKSPIDFL